MLKDLKDMLSDVVIVPQTKASWSRTVIAGLLLIVATVMLIENGGDAFYPAMSICVIATIALATNWIEAAAPALNEAEWDTLKGWLEHELALPQGFLPDTLESMEDVFDAIHSLGAAQVQTRQELRATRVQAADLSDFKADVQKRVREANERMRGTGQLAEYEIDNPIGTLLQYAEDHADRYKETAIELKHARQEADEIQRQVDRLQAWVPPEDIGSLADMSFEQSIDAFVASCCVLERGAVQAQVDVGRVYYRFCTEVGVESRKINAFQRMEEIPGVWRDDNPDDRSFYGLRLKGPVDHLYTLMSRAGQDEEEADDQEPGDVHRDLMRGWKVEED